MRHMKVLYPLSHISISMIEIEIKAQADHKALLSALKDAGTTFEKTADQHDTYYTYYDAPHRDLGETDEAFCLREQSGLVYMTYKGKKLDAKSKTHKKVEDINTTLKELKAKGAKITMEPIPIIVGTSCLLKISEWRPDSANSTPLIPILIYCCSYLLL